MAHKTHNNPSKALHKLALEPGSLNLHAIKYTINKKNLLTALAIHEHA